MFDHSSAQERLRTMHINHPIIDGLEKDILSHVQNGFRGDGAMAFVLKGDTGSGKTRVLDQVIASLMKANLKPIVEKGGVTVKPLPAAYCRVPTDTTTRSASKKLARTLGATFNERASADDLTSVNLSWLKRRHVKLLILDEIHHFVQREGDRPAVITNAANFLKLLLDDGNVPIVFVGTPDLEPLLDHDGGQLRMRVSRTKIIPPFSFDDEQERDDFRTVLYNFEQEIALPMPSNLTELDLAERIHIAASGYVGRVFRLLHAAIEVAASQNHKFLNRDNLAVAFHEGASVEQQQRNPFVIDDISGLRKKMPKSASPFQTTISGRKKPKMSANDMIRFG